MKKSAADDTHSGRRICVALAFVVAVFDATADVAADQHRRWPRPTYYTIVARTGDSLGTIARRYRVSPSLVARFNSLKATDRMSAGHVVYIPADTRATREAVLSEATDRSAPNYATRPGSPSVAHSAVSYARVMASIASPPRRAATGIQAADEGRPRLLRFAWPIAGPVISPFGPGGHGTRNEGINIAAERGAPFRAAADGTVSYAGPLRGYGNIILITHSHSYITAYAHADDIAVVRGEFVEKGHVIGTAGTTGGVDRPQVHFEIRRGVTPVDPNLLLAANS